MLPVGSLAACQRAVGLGSKVVTDEAGTDHSDATNRLRRYHDYSEVRTTHKTFKNNIKNVAVYAT